MLHLPTFKEWMVFFGNYKKVYVLIQRIFFSTKISISITMEGYKEIIEVALRLPRAWTNIGVEKGEMLEASGRHTAHGDVKLENLNESSRNLGAC